jgi:hypothetical protein
MTEETLQKANELQAKIVNVQKVKTKLAQMCDKHGMTIAGWRKDLVGTVADIFFGSNAIIEVKGEAIVKEFKAIALQLLDKEEARLVLELEALK